MSNTDKTTVDIPTLIQKGGAGLDTSRAVAFQNLLTLQQAKSNVIQRELLSAQKSGDQNAINDSTFRIDVNKNLVTSLNREVLISKIAAPTANPNATIVHGFVWHTKDGMQQPATNLKLGVYYTDEYENRVLIKEVKTNKQGYYNAVVPLNAKASSDDRKTADRTNVFVAAIAESKSAAQTASFPLAASAVQFRELTLDDSSS